MANTPESISHIQIGQDVHPIDAVTVEGKTLTTIKSDFSDDFQLKENMVNSLATGASNIDDSHYPTAKAVYDIIGDLERRLSNI